jgi:transposase
MTELRDRVERGREIAASPDQIEKVAPGIWSVRSQSGIGVYLVSRAEKLWKCICPDFQSHGVACKHILAVRLSNEKLTPQMAREKLVSGPRATFRQQWSAYNQARRSERLVFDSILTELLGEVEDPRPVTSVGRPRLPLQDVLHCAVQKVYQKIPLRLAHGLSDQLLADGHVSVSPSRNMSSIMLRRADITPILHCLIAKSALPLASLESTFAVDSSGFRTTSFGEYRRWKYGVTTQNVWVKAHIIVGTRTQIVPKVIVTHAHSGDSPEFSKLVDGTVSAGFVMKEVYADKGYLSGANYEAARQAGATAYILFKRNSRGHAQLPRISSPLWKKMWHLFQSDPNNFYEHYHKRENVEAAFGAVKKRLGETLSSRDPVARENELLVKFLAWNISVLVHEAFEHQIAVPGLNRERKDRALPHPTPEESARPCWDADLPDWTEGDN